MIVHHKQVSILDCGLASLKTILSYYNIDSGSVDKHFDVKSSQGMSLLDIERVLRRYGVQSESYQIEDMSYLSNVDTPYIAVVMRNSLPHYVVVCECEDDNFKISDPAELDFVIISKEHFQHEFSGIVLIPGTRLHSILERPHTVTVSQARKLYDDFISGIGFLKKCLIFSIGVAKAVLPILMTMALQYLMVNVLMTSVNAQLFILLGLVLSLLLWQVCSQAEVRIKTELENEFLFKILNQFYEGKLNSYRGSKNYDFTMGYFWNLLTSVSGIVNKFYIKIHMSVFLIIMLGLFIISPVFGGITLIATVALVIYVRQCLVDVEVQQRQFIVTSSNFTHHVESSINGLFDIVAFNQSDSFSSEFKRRLSDLLTIKLTMAELSNKISISVQVFSIMLGSCLIIAAHFFKIFTNYLDYTNVLITVVLLSAFIQPLLNIWVAYKKSLYSLDYINLREEDEDVEEVNLGINDIFSMTIKNLEVKFSENNILQNFNLHIEKGKVYVITGDNGTGKSTLVKIISGFLKPSGGEIVINGNSSYSSLLGTDILKHIAMYTNEFEVFSGSVENNILFSLFENSKINYKQNEFVGLPNNYQISTQGRNISQGQKQKILIQRALAVSKDKSIYIFDEPTTNLDEKSKKEFYKLLESLKSRGKIVCVITHDREMIHVSDEIFQL